MIKVAFVLYCLALSSAVITWMIDAFARHDWSGFYNLSYLFLLAAVGVDIIDRIPDIEIREVEEPSLPDASETKEEVK